MGQVIRFISKSELERARLIREARANYERVFPSADSGDQQDGRPDRDGTQVSSEP